MATSIKLMTPMPTFEQVAKKYGVGKARREAISNLALGKRKASQKRAAAKAASRGMTA